MLCILASPSFPDYSTQIPNRLDDFQSVMVGFDVVSNGLFGAMLMLFPHSFVSQLTGSRYTCNGPESALIVSAG
jgi:hypothetical protein